MRTGVGVVQQNQFELLAEKLGCTEWLEDPRFANPDARRKNAAAVFDAVSGSSERAMPPTGKRT